MTLVKAIRVRFYRGKWRAEWWQNSNGNWHSRQTQPVRTIDMLWNHLEWLFGHPEVRVARRKEVML